LAGYARHTFSLSVILLECSEQINMFIPMVLCILISFWTGDIFNKSIYVIGVRTKNIPFLGEHIPHKVQKVTADTMMKSPVRTLPPIATVE
jgi:H+/Cl- antiporter ClcA